MHHLLFSRSGAWLRLGALALSPLLASALACSSNPAPPTEAQACAVLAAQGLPCSPALDAGVPPDLDATVPCELTGTCTSTFDAAVVTNGFDANVTSPDDAGSVTPYDAAPPPEPDADVSEDAGPDCGTPPALHPETQPGVYCPFTAAGPLHCPATEQCCEAPSDAGGSASTCEVLGATCPFAGSLTWECDGPVDCAGSAAGAVCCAGGSLYTDPVCGYERGTGFQGSHCATSCAAGELPLCAAATDPCAAGTTCTPFKVAGVVLGTCL